MTGATPMKNNDTPSIERLKPCPFCGEEPELRNDDDEVMREIVCSTCDFTITESANPEGAVARWNTRATLETLTPSAGEGVERPSLSEHLEDRNAEPPTVSYQHLSTPDLISQAGDLREQMFRAGDGGYVISKTRYLCTLSGSMLSALTTRLALTPSPPLEQPDIEGRAREIRREALEEAAKVADYAVERAERDWHNPDKQDAVRQVGAEIAEVIRAYKDGRPCPSSRPSFDKWDFAGAVLADARCAK